MNTTLTAVYLLVQLTIGSGTASATYSYRTGTRQIASVTFKDGSTTRLTQTRTYDNIHRPTG